MFRRSRLANTDAIIGRSFGAPVSFSTIEASVTTSCIARPRSAARASTWRHAARNCSTSTRTTSGPVWLRGRR